MKRKTISRITTLIWMVAFGVAACPAWATTPLATPLGLAVNANGNLYVANYGGNEILVYNPSYVQTKTITAGVKGPTGIAFNSQGLMYVANSGSASVTVYDATGKQIPTATITAGLTNPIAIAVDGADDVWVDDATTSLKAYSPGGTFLNTLSFGSGMPTIAAHGRYVDVAFSTSFEVFFTGEALTAHIAGAQGQPTSFIGAMTSDSHGNFYYCQKTGEVDTFNPFTGLASAIVSVGYAPTGVAVDTTRKRIYLSNSGLGVIDVYSTSGVFIKTIL